MVCYLFVTVLLSAEDKEGKPSLSIDVLPSFSVYWGVDFNLPVVYKL
jgi:hypothetical protein